ncbi:MAG: TetR/AcrR family transcriptional regulator [Hyphomonas sp.]
MSIREDFQRARTEHEKSARREEILDAAERLVRGAANDRFAISAVAEKVGVSKSTIFLYFANKEELLLALYERAFQRFFTRLRESLTDGMSGRAFCEAFIDSALVNPTMLILRAQLAHTIERSVQLDSMISAKQKILKGGMACAERMELVLDIKAGYGLRVLMALINLLSGALQADAQPYVDMDTLPDDVANLVRTAGTRKVFLSGAEFVITGATGRAFG